MCICWYGCHNCCPHVTILGAHPGRHIKDGDIAGQQSTRHNTRLYKVATMSTRSHPQRLLYFSMVYCHKLYLSLPRNSCLDTSHIPRATCHGPHATSHMPRATCHEPHATSHNRWHSSTASAYTRGQQPAASTHRLKHKLLQYEHTVHPSLDTHPTSRRLLGVI